jgi:hypothetical protein
MAFNPLNTFQKNKRFWMAMILGICMVSFIFCTGIKGDMADKLIALMTGRSGPGVVTIDGRSFSDRDLSDLKTQRNLANTFMRVCDDIANKNLAKFFFDEGKRQVPEKDMDARRQQLALLTNIRAVIDQRRAKPRYFEIGTKFDDLVEFKLWQAEADRLGIRLEPSHITFLFNMQFFGERLMHEVVLRPGDISFAQMQAKRDIHRDASDAFIHHAIGEEFRVQIAQYVVLKAQPFSYLFRNKRDAEGFTFKFSDPGMPDETRAPLTMAQLYDIFKAKRSEFTVDLLPIKIEDFIATLKEEPTEDQKRAFFEEHKGKAFDPSTDPYALEISPSSKIEFVYADPKSEFYLGKAKLISALKATNSIAFNANLSPLGAMAQYVAAAQKHKADLQAQYDTLASKDKISRDDRYRGAALFSDPDCAAPVLAFMAGHHPDLVTSWIGTSALSPLDGLSSFLAQGAARHPAEVEAALRSEADRRAPRYAALFGTIAGTQNLLDIAAPVLMMDATTRYRSPEKLRRAAEMANMAAQLGLKPPPIKPEEIEVWDYVHPLYTVETVQTTLQKMIDERMAEEWAQENMLALRGELEKANDDPGKYRRVLNQQHIKDMHLTYGPPAESKHKYYNRFEIGDAEEFKVLKESYLKYLDMINLFEGRDISAGGVLKASDYPKMFFDRTELFSAASSLHRAMPWPPEVSAKPRSTRLLNPRLLGEVAPADIQRFENHIGANDPNREPPKLDLFKTAARPILFWRTAEILANRPANYDKIGKDIEEFKAERAKIDAELAKNPANDLLLGKYAKAGKAIEDLKAERAKIEADLAKNPKDDALQNKYAKLGKDIEEFKAERTKVEADLAKNPKNIVPLSKKGELEQAEADLRTIQSRIVEGWKAEQARKLALPEAKKAAEKVLDHPKDLRVGLEKAAEHLKTELNQKNVALISLPKLSQLHPEKFAGRGTDYGPPQFKDDRIKYPRGDMMKQLLNLYDLSSEIKTVNPDDPTTKVNAELDAINKEFYDRVAKAGAARGAYVQILTNKPRTVYYVAAVTQLPKAEDKLFAKAMMGAPFTLDADPRLVEERDHFADRAQEDHARIYRREVIDALKILHKVEIINADARKKFDEHGGID